MLPHWPPRSPHGCNAGACPISSDVFSVIDAFVGETLTEFAVARHMLCSRIGRTGPTW
jgi:hypothetical protein